MFLYHVSPSPFPNAPCVSTPSCSVQTGGLLLNVYGQIAYLVQHLYSLAIINQVGKSVLYPYNKRKNMPFLPSAFISNSPPPQCSHLRS